ncbi:MAG: rubrerythrin family protein [Methanomicrobiales archaeon]|jgi:rubrerythrin|nr:rubrerythrin family protein [Methanomicrobiales archaeon]
MSSIIEKNLMDAFAGESQANRKYASFSAKAIEDGFPSVGKLFKAASQAEEIHARRHLEVANKVKSTVENLEVAVAGEVEESTVMYPRMLAEAQGDVEATRTFMYACEAERVHADHYKEALAAVKSGKDLNIKKVLLCIVCGNIVYDTAPAACPICGAATAAFVEIE